jgi:DNA-directed RNA polymerase sigma subunit (sigma70/sigma32)
MLVRRRTSDKSGRILPPGTGARVRIQFNDGRTPRRADLLDDEVKELLGHVDFSEVRKRPVIATRSRTELEDLQRAVETRHRKVDQSFAALDAAVLCAYRAERDDGTPAFTLAEIAEVMGVTRQRVHQLVREIALKRLV